MRITPRDSAIIIMWGSVIALGVGGIIAAFRKPSHSDKGRVEFDDRYGPCVLQAMRSVLGIHEGNATFDNIVRGYWEKGHGTTCAVVANWALSKCGLPDKVINRGPNSIPGNHVPPLQKYAREKGAYIDTPQMARLEPGDLIYLQTPGDPSGWHVGFVEKNLFPKSIITLDGGQTDAAGRQSIGRVERKIFGGVLLGPTPRQVMFAIRTPKLIALTPLNA